MIDDGQPVPTPTTSWSVLSGPAGVSVADPGAIDTTATFPGEGTYVQELTADDTELQASDTVTVIVEAAPVLATITVTPDPVSLTPGEVALFDELSGLLAPEKWRRAQRRDSICPWDWCAAVGLLMAETVEELLLNPDF